MLPLVSLILSLGLSGYLLWESVRSPRVYRRLRQDIAGGDRSARCRFYRQIVRFELLSAGWAMAAVYIGGGAFAPGPLELGELGPMRWLSVNITAALVGGAIGVVAVGLVLLRSRARKAPPARRVRRSGWRSRLAGKVVPDYGPLLPESRRERLWFVAVSVSAGVCEEIVFRGWLLAFLHDTWGLHGSLLVVVAAAVFGLGHAYQGVLGVIGTGYLGAVFVILYVASGSLLLPIVLHILVDVKGALLPRARASSISLDATV